MHPAQAEAVLRHIAMSRMRGLGELQQARAAVQGRLFGLQQGVVADAAKRIVVRCGRRSGKSVLVAALCVLSALAGPGAQALYIALTRGNAKRLMLPEIERLKEVTGIPMQINRADLVIEVGRQGGRLFLGGADNERSIDKYRGFHFGLVCLDEMGYLGPHLAALVDDVLEPTTMDTDGAMLGVSSPPPALVGKFWDIDQPSSGWSRYHWNVLQNPHIPHAARWLAELRRTRGWDESHPTYRREYLGEWVEDASALCYAFDAERNTFHGQLDRAHMWRHVLGVDVGYDPDPTAFVVIAYSLTCRVAYVVHAQRETQWTPSRVWAHVEALHRQYHLERIVVDGTKGQVAELAQRFAQPVTFPEAKHLKRQHIELMSDEMRQGKIAVVDTAHCLIQELRTVTWDEARKGPAAGVPNDCTDALEYAWVASGHYVAKEPEVLSAEQVVDREEQAMRQRAESDARVERELERHDDMRWLLGP